MSDFAVLEINPSTRSPEQEFAGILEKNPHIKSFKIRVSVSSLDLVLSGKVPTFFQKQVAQTAVKELAELRGLSILNNIEVV